MVKLSLMKAILAVIVKEKQEKLPYWFVKATRKSIYSSGRKYQNRDINACYCEENQA